MSAPRDPGRSHTGFTGISLSRPLVKTLTDRHHKELWTDHGLFSQARTLEFQLCSSPRQVLTVRRPWTPLVLKSPTEFPCSRLGSPARSSPPSQMGLQFDGESNRNDPEEQDRRTELCRPGADRSSEVAQDDNRKHRSPRTGHVEKSKQAPGNLRKAWET